jgi:hypothetical protein
MNGIILLKSSRILSLAHQDQNRGGTIEDRVATSFVSLPGRYKVRQALLEEILVNFDICHGSRVDVDGRDGVGGEGGRRGDAMGVNFAPD